jgi:protein-tyrosine phosphatase
MWPYIILLAVGGLVVVGSIIARRNRLDPLDPLSLIIEPPDANLAERIIPLEGTFNFRDIGGYRTAAGKRVRKGLVYRSGELHSLTDSDLDFLHRAGIKLVCDLRSAEEIQAEPDRLPENPAPTYVHLPLNTDADHDRWERLFALFFNRRKLAAMMPEAYKRMMIDGNARLYGDILRRLSEPENLPAIIHCTAGKDRTGIAVALLLKWLGVPDDTIIADYSLSNRYFERFYEHGARAVRSLNRLGITGEHIKPLLVANPEAMREALGHLDAQYGSIAGYLRDVAGLDDAALARLRERLLEDNSSSGSS